MPRIETREHIPISFAPLAGRGDDILRAALRRFREHDIPYFVTGGTLLGLVRDGDLIATDTDVDFSVAADEVTEDKVRAASNGWPLAREVFIDPGTMAQNLLGIGPARETQQLVYLPDDVIFDVHFYRKRGDGYECHHSAGVLEFAAGTFEESQEIETEKFGAVRVPRDPEAYLLSKYGDDWTVPANKKGIYRRRGMRS